MLHERTGDLVGKEQGWGETLPRSPYRRLVRRSCGLALVLRRGDEGSDTNGCRTVDKPLNLTLDLEHAHVSSHHQLPRCGLRHWHSEKARPDFRV